MKQENPTVRKGIPVLQGGEDVNFVIVGRVGARLQGAPNITDDLDIVPEPTPGNLARLAAALSGPSTTKKAGNSTEYLAHPSVEPAASRLVLQLQ
ncbi:hypothetical protein FRACA_2210006 [Frankia canadensis]|uniref:Uncharacterized protein n=1 Tax=Frankia canadensis TaxID=1836972 RepID=A0A2I2KR36_9ACTN|nr:hypothetical protein [Frankia canadensis]SNQ48133.1 hypothetical protein FRACA_2210006 [Frankia canadensis]SOU55423.1 hypothetical protein FRACA_2210006 [Frankia canadensis]